MENTLVNILSTDANLSLATEKIIQPGYQRSAVGTGIFHLGVGAFHRAHQAVYYDDLLRYPDQLAWGLCGADILPAAKDLHADLQSQDCLYTVLSRDSEREEVRVIGSIKELLFKSDSSLAILRKMSQPEIKIVSMTITEGGYLFDDQSRSVKTSDLNFLHDLAHPEDPKTAFGFIVEALRLRKEAGVAPFTVLSCDNLQHNGDIAREVTVTLARGISPSLANWIESEVTFPNSVVDRITPVTKESDSNYLREKYQIADLRPVVPETFRQWVIEDHFCNGRPALERVGVQMVDDVLAYEQAKLRILNAGHSALGYVGSLRGYQTVGQVIQDPLFEKYLRITIDLEIKPYLKNMEGLDLDDYRNQVIKRFKNPNIQDQLSRICMDGSAKIPKFVLPSLEIAVAEQSQIEGLSLIIASWIVYLKGFDQKGKKIIINDPNANSLQELARAGVNNFINQDLFPKSLKTSGVFKEQVQKYVVSLEMAGVKATLERFNKIHDHFM